MPNSVLVGILGGGAYDFVKSLTGSLLGEQSDELTQKVYAALEEAADHFFETYGDQFGEPNNSFLARKENWETVLRSVYYSSDALDAQQLNGAGYRGAENAPPEVVNHFVALVEGKMHDDWFLDKILTDKSHREEVVQNQEAMAKTLSSLISKTGDDATAKEEHRLAHPDYPDGWLPEEGKPYTQLFPNGGKVNFVRQGNIIHLKQTLPSGAKVYYEIDQEGSLKDIDLPYPLKEYELLIPDSIVLRKQVGNLPGGLKQVTIKLKWGAGTAQYIRNPNGELGQIDIQSRVIMRHEKRIIEIPAPEFQG